MQHPFQVPRLKIHHFFLIWYTKFNFQVFQQTLLQGLSFSIPEDKLKKVRKMLCNLKHLTVVKARGSRQTRRKVHAKVLAKVLGTLQSLRLVTGPFTAVMTRALYSRGHLAELLRHAGPVSQGQGLVEA